MIVPIVFSLLMIRDIAPYLWFFYKCLHTFADCGYPFVVMEEYLTSPAKFAEIGRLEAIERHGQSIFGYTVPSDIDIENTEKFVIPDVLIEEIVKSKGSRQNAAVSLYKDRNTQLEEFLENTVLSVMKSGRKISAFLTLANYPFVDAIAEKYSITVINTEQGALREPVYLPTMFYDTNSLYKKSSQEVRYNRFLEEVEAAPTILLSAEEILAIVVSKPYLGYIEESKKKPIYKLGVALGWVGAPHCQSQTLMDDQEILWMSAKRFKPKEYLVRKHPGDLAGAQYLTYDYCRDTSPNTIDFVLKCETIVSLGSNVSFEAMLFGRNSIVFVDCPASYMAYRSFDVKMTGLCEEEYLNFFVFCYLVPYDLFWNNDYLLWRLANPPETEIYQRHLEHHLSAKGIQQSPWEFPSDMRIKYLLDKQGFKISEWKSPAAKRTKFTPREYQREIDRLRKLLSDKERELETMRGGY